MIIWVDRKGKPCSRLSWETERPAEVEALLKAIDCLCRPGPATFIVPLGSTGCQSMAEAVGNNLSVRNPAEVHEIR